MSRNIFKLEQEYLELLNNIEELEGELTSEIEEQLAINLDDFEAKMMSYSGLISYLKGDLFVINDELQRLTDLKKSKENIIERLKTTMRDAILIYGDDGKSGNKTLDLGSSKFYTKKNEVVKVYDEEEFLVRNMDYVRTKINGNFNKKDAIGLLPKLKEYNEDVNLNYSIDKVSLKADLKAGVVIDGVSLVRNDNLIIK